MPRPDLIEAGIGPGNGFSAFLPRPLWVDDAISLHAEDGSVARARIDSATAARIAELTRYADPARQTGLEIGPLDRPLIPKGRFRVFYLDQASKQVLTSRYQGHGVHIPSVVDPDFAVGDGDFLAAVGALRFDYAIASHVIEHVPDMVTWLADIASILKPGGELRLVIPDRRYTFDILRLETRLHDVLDAYVRRAAIPSPRAILEHYLLLRRVPEPADWPAAGLDLPALQPYAGVEFALNLARDALANGTYHDVHCWIFTPRSFLGLCHELAKAGLLSFQLGYWIDTAVKDKEFFAGLRRCDNHAEAVASWARALNGRPA